MDESEQVKSRLTSYLVPAWGKAEKAAVEEWLAGASHEDAVQELEQRVARDFGSDYTVRLFNLGRSALQVVLEAMRLGPEDEVLLPSLICTGVVAAVIRSGAAPVFVDVDERFNVRMGSVLEAASPRVRAIIFPHMAGAWARDSEAIVEWAKPRGIFVVEDCAQAQGLEVGGRMAGTLGDAAIFSSHGAKVLAGSGGGWAVTRQPDLARAIAARALPKEPRESVRHRVEAFARSAGVALAGTQMARLDEPISRGSRHVEPAEMSDLEARLLLLQWSEVPYVTRCRIANANRWRSLLESTHLPGLRLPPPEKNVYCKMLLSFDGDSALSTSKSLRQALLNAGVETEDWYAPLHLRAPFSRFRRAAMPVSERVWRAAFSVPVRPNLDALDWQRIESALAGLFASA